MKTTDTYTKIILTIIALFLGIIALQNSSIIPTAKADPKPAPLPLPAYNGTIDVNIKSVAGSSIYNYNEGIPVTIKNSSLKVESDWRSPISVAVESGKIDANVTNYRDFR